jgi:ribosomal protein S18 acetylase RimI-like enzyme
MLKLDLIVYSDEALDEAAALILENKLHCHGSELMDDGSKSLMAIMCNDQLVNSENEFSDCFGFVKIETIILCHLDDKPIAAAIVANWIYTEQEQPNLLNVYVQPEHRNMGIGSDLISELLSLGIIDENTKYKGGGNLENHVS